MEFTGNACSRVFALLVTTVLAAAPAVPAWASEVHRFDIPEEDAAAAIHDFGSQAHVQILVAGEAVKDKKLHAVSGDLSTEDALNRLLAGSGLSHKYVGDSSIALLPASLMTEGPTRVASPADQRQSGPGDRSSLQLAQLDQASPGPKAVTQDNKEQTKPSEALEEIVVTGSHIRGVQPSSPVTSFSLEDMRLAGETNLGEAIRDLPNNFNGGQNPGVVLGANTSNSANINATAASSIDLRGLGPDATLTLINGRRPSYSGISQATDVSTIPLLAVDHVEVLLDGASAIYGSDAVAGVANIVLRRNFEGVSVSAGYGAATSGGDNTTTASAIGGTSWSSGGLYVAGTFQKNTAINTSQREFASGMPQDHNTLYPEIEQKDVLLSAHEAVTAALDFSIDALYASRSSANDLNFGFFYEENGITDRAYFVSPTVQLTLADNWRLSLNGTVSEDNTDFDTAIPVFPVHVAGCYCNASQSAEVDADGALFRLSGGDAKMSLGVGYRSNSFDYRNENVVAAVTTLTHGSLHDYFGFGELQLPFVSPEQQVPLVKKLVWNGAFRYEDYTSFGSVWTPKVGLTWAPTSEVELSSTWGKSFKTPTLNQQFTPTQVSLYPAASLGASGLPASATALLVDGGSLNLSPERANTLSASLKYRPHWLEGAAFDVGYFNVKYSGRVELPIGANEFSALASNTYAAYITSSPSVAQQQQIIAMAAPGQFTNVTGAPYDPSTVVAIVDDRYVNVARQAADGVDFHSSYNFSLLGGRATILGDGTWLEGSRQIIATLPRQATAGVVFNPPHFRGRFGASWSDAGFTVSSFVNYIGGVEDNRTASAVEGGSQTTVDLIADYQIRGEGLLGGFDVTLTARNLFNIAPPFLQPIPAAYPNYDSTNYSPIGRFINLAVTKRF